MTEAGQPTLRIYITPDCAGCRTARTLAEAVRHRRPHQPVEVIDLAEHPDAPLPPGVIGTPTYLLAGDVVSLGNPELHELLSRLDTAAGASGVD